MSDGLDSAPFWHGMTDEEYEATLAAVVWPIDEEVTARVSAGIERYRSIIEAILREREWQDEKYGSIETRGLALHEYIWIAWEEMCEARVAMARGDGEDALRELLQVMAVGWAALEAYGVVERPELEEAR